VNDLIHLDAAGCARRSPATEAAVAAHLRREQEVGGYVAEAEAEPTIRQLRADLGALLGAAGEHVALTESASTAFASLLRAWPLPPGAQVGTVSTEYRTNQAALAAADIELVAVPVDGIGHIDAARVAGVLPLDLLAFPVVPSHLGIVQPVHEILSTCRSAGVPVVLDVAQALGHVEVPEADAAVGTSRKWLRGPRGVGFLAVSPSWAGRVQPGRLDHDEATIAGRIGLANAVAELRAAGPASVAAQVATMGRLARSRLQGVGGWQVCEPIDEPTGLVTLRHPSVAPEDAVRSLLASGIVTSAPFVGSTNERVLRASFHVYSSPADVEALVAGLAAVT
jgi:pyridoxal 5-phosphate dependent beta-lyase